MNLIGVILVSPLWGAISTQLFLQSWLAFINFVINLIGLLKGNVEKKVNLIGLGAALTQVILFAVLLRGSQYLLTEVLGFGYTTYENVAYWIFAVLSILYMIPQLPAKIRKSWRNATVAGSLDEDIMKRKLGIPSG